VFATSLPESLEGGGESATVRGGDSPRLKKRRLFNGPQATFSSVIGDAPPPVQQMLQPLKVRTLEKSFVRIKRVSKDCSIFLLRLDPSAVAIDFAHFLLILQLFEDPLRHDEDRHGILSSMPAIWYASNGNHLPHQQLDSDHPVKNIFRLACAFVSICIMDL
jgi:hypothetical protein